MKKRSILFLTFLIALTMSTAACKNAETESLAESVGEEAVVSVKEDQPPDKKETETEDAADFTGNEEKSETEDEPGMENEDEMWEETADERSAETAEEMMKTAYTSVLENICFEHIFPPPIGNDLGFDEMFDPAYNKFAVYDIDQDGRTELIIIYTTTCSAGMKVFIYDFDAEMGTVREEFSEYPSVTFYDNGIVEAEWSHNHGNAADRDDFWPYNVYRYNPEKDTYMLEALVDAWSVEFAEKDSAGNPFPKEADIDGDGMLYRVTAYKLNEPIDGEEYRQWREECIGEAELIELPFLSITEENIYTWNDEGE